MKINHYFLPNLNEIAAVIVLCLAFNTVSYASDSDIEKVTVLGKKHQYQSVTTATSATIDLTSNHALNSKLTDVLNQVSGVELNGQGGLFQVFSLRGASRWRVTTQLSGMPLHTERRAGAAASFVDPYLLASVEILKGPVSTLYGSGAIGGMVLINPRFFDGLNIEAATSTGDHNQQFHLGWGGKNISLAYAQQSANDAYTPDGMLLNSHFQQRSASMQGQWQLQDQLTLTLSNIASWGDDIGKVNNDDFLNNKATTYPDEYHWVTSIGLQSQDSWQLNVALHDQSLQTQVQRFNTSTNWVDNKSTDYSVNFFTPWQVDNFGGHVGIEQQYRQGVTASERQLSLSSNELSNMSILDANQYEWAFFADVNRRFGDVYGATGARINGIRQQNKNADVLTDQAWTYFAQLSYQPKQQFSLSALISQGFRFPSLTELYFNGTTGRGYLIGNTELKPEKSLNYEVSALWEYAAHSFDLSVYRNEVSDYIESIDIDEETRSYLNLTHGVIKGIEYQYRYRFSEHIDLSLIGHVLKGENDQGDALADIPANKIQMGVKFSKDNWQGEFSIKHRFSKNTVAYSEQNLSAANIVSASVNYHINEQWLVTLSGQNITDELYLSSTDRKSTFAPERSIGVKISWKMQ
ncbi:TonB-dependent receptor plug domain-containing protein [Colwelliaceae bacterium 6471]